MRRLPSRRLQYSDADENTGVNSLRNRSQATLPIGRPSIRDTVSKPSYLSAATILIALVGLLKSLEW